jgi:hypothetical protein
MASLIILDIDLRALQAVIEQFVIGSSSKFSSAISSIFPRPSKIILMMLIE